MSAAIQPAPEVELSESEAALLQTLRTREQQWPTMRWVLLALAAFNLFNGWREFANGGEPAFAMLFVIVGLMGVAKAAVDWRGNPSRALLLKLLEPTRGVPRAAR